jgi:membrane-associated phospholipid phosphatase
VLLAACRVIGGVHWVKDVVVGALAGIVAGLVGFW